MIFYGTIQRYRHELRSLLRRVEKAVSKVPGVASCSVSLLTNSMGVEGTASSAEIIKAVQDAGYGASPKRAGAAAASSTSADLDALADHETPKLKRRSLRRWAFCWC